MCELIPIQGDVFDQEFTIRENGDTVTIDTWLSRAALIGVSDQGKILQCLEPAGWEDLPWPNDNQQIHVPAGTKLRVRYALQPRR